MKKLIWSLLIAILIISACQQTEPQASKQNKNSDVKQSKTIEQKNQNQTFAYPNLLAGNGAFYSLLTIGKPDERSPIEKNRKIINHVHDILSLPYAQAKKIYPKLNIDHDPEYFLFDQYGVIFKTNTLNDLAKFLQKNKSTH